MPTRDNLKDRMGWGGERRGDERKERGSKRGEVVCGLETRGLSLQHQCVHEQMRFIKTNAVPRL
jgi:hypothetical protein